MQTQEKTVSLNDIVQFELPPIFRWQHLNRDVVIGFIGDRGDGKSVGAGVTAVMDYMLQCEPCYANIPISAEFEVDEDTASKYGLETGTASYVSQELDIVRLLTGTGEYVEGVIVVDEVNIAIADARRSMANQNLAADDLVQQIRKDQSALIYTCIDEGFVDVRIRDMTDIMIKTMDTALTPEGLARKQTPGEEFKWIIYPMTRKLTGERYQDTGRTLPPAYLKGRRWWDVIDSGQKQKRKKFNLKTDNEGVNAGIEVSQNPELAKTVNEWEWVGQKILELRDSGYTEIYPYELWDFLELEARGITPRSIQTRLGQYGVYKAKRNDVKYQISQFRLQ